MIECDTIKDFYNFEKAREKRKWEFNISAYVKETDTKLIFMDEYNTGLYEWSVVDGKFLNYFEPLAWHPLEHYM